MKLTITATDKVTTVDGVRARVWEGVHENGSKCLVFVCRLATPDAKAGAALSRALLEMPAPVEAPAAEILAAFARQLQREN